LSCEADQQPAAGPEIRPRIRQPHPSARTRRRDKWHLDEVVITIADKKRWFWRAVDQEGLVLDVLVQSQRNKKAAKRLFRKRLKKQGRAPRVLITDKLKSYAAAKWEFMPGVEHRQHKGLNNRAENSHQPTRRRERIMKRFNSPRQVQRFLSTHDQIANVFSSRPNQDTAIKFHSARNQAFTTLGWDHRRDHGRVIRLVDRRHSTHLPCRYCIDDKLTVPSQAFARMSVAFRPTATDGVWRVFFARFVNAEGDLRINEINIVTVRLGSSLNNKSGHDGD
jgi:putative transposase